MDNPVLSQVYGLVTSMRFVGRSPQKLSGMGVGPCNKNAGTSLATVKSSSSRCELATQISENPFSSTVDAALRPVKERGCPQRDNEVVARRSDRVLVEN